MRNIELHVKLTYLRETRELIIDSADGLLDGLLKRATDAHDLTHGLHAAAEQPTDAVELLEIPARNLHHDVVQTRLKARARNLCDGILDLIQRNAETQLCSDESQRIPSSF